MYSKWVDDMAALAQQREGGGTTVFDRPLSLKIYDYLRSRAGTPDCRKRKHQGYFQYDLDVSEDGVITRTYPNKTVNTYRNKQLVGTIDRETLGPYQSFSGFLKATGFNTSPTGLPGISGIRSIDLDDEMMTESMGIISSSKFMKVASLISPQIENGSLLFAINTGTENPYFSLDGVLPFKGDPKTPFKTIILPKFLISQKTRNKYEHR